MTDARFPERWLNDRRVARLSDGAFRTFVTTLTWSVANRTDGVVELDDLDFIHGADRRHVQGLVSSGLWSRTAKDIFLITVFKETQTSRHEMEVLEHLRKREREKKARQRARGGSEDDVSPGTSRGMASPGTVPRDGIGQKDRQARHVGVGTSPDGSATPRWSSPRTRSTTGRRSPSPVLPTCPRGSTTSPCRGLRPRSRWVPAVSAAIPR